MVHLTSTPEKSFLGRKTPSFLKANRHKKPNRASKRPPAKADSRYSLTPDGRFIIEDYNHAKSFTNFFPGIAGLWGIPMWAFYVNRGQCLASFGIESKDKAIMEFQPANKAYRLTSTHGFRTFLKIADKDKSVHYEPFQNHTARQAADIQQNMIITSHDLTIEDKNPSLGLEVVVNYFTVPNEPFTALVRRLTVRNTSRKSKLIEVIDGMPVILPYGYNDWFSKNMCRTIEAWVQVSNLEKKVPYFNLKVVVSDRPQVEHIHEGNFYLAFLNEGSDVKRLETIVDPENVFGTATDFLSPDVFIQDSKFNVSPRQFTDNKTPCAMSYGRLNIPPGGHKEIISLIGHIHSLKELNAFLQRKLSADYIKQKSEENRLNIDQVKKFAFTHSSRPAFDAYCAQTFLDNVLRGGLPVSLKTRDGNIAFSVYTRKHGDPERDYNHFSLSPTFLSQGNGNFRDVNQNRRNDVWFNPDVKDSAIINFLSLIQADGYNPLVIEGMSFSIEDARVIKEVLQSCFEKKDHETVRGWLADWFMPGELLYKIMKHDVRLKKPPKEFLSMILANSQKRESAKHGEGFWSDHWTYNLDLIESYLAVYPEEKRRLLLEKKEFSFYFNNHFVANRDQRFVLTWRGVRQYHALAKSVKEAKIEREHKLKVHHGQGPVYHTTLMSKLLCLIANKAATFDPSGIGVEMEAEKPNWYDALNGLPGLVGSSLSETFELERFCRFLQQMIEDLDLPQPHEVEVFDELHAFIEGLKGLLSQNLDPLTYWMRSNEIKEHYRARIRHGIDGMEKGLSIGMISEFLRLVIDKCRSAAKAARDAKGRYVTYFCHEVTEFEKLNKHSSDGQELVWPVKFARRNLPLFLEGFVHALRVEKESTRAREIYQSVRNSPLFDRTLNMYKVNADLSRETEEIGRARVFPRGWLENESIWLHMEYKFLLELLRCGLYDEFYENMKTTMVPFLSPDVYGRSILENSSFLVSSAHNQKDLHGRGFVSRLSGTTAELVHIWLIMSAGERPFSLDQSGVLTLKFDPILPGWLFSQEPANIDLAGASLKTQKIFLDKDIYAFNFMGSTLVVYHNPKRKNTFGEDKATVYKIILHYPGKSPVSLSSAVIPAPYALEVRDRKLERIDVYLQ